MLTMVRYFVVDFKIDYDIWQFSDSDSVSGAILLRPKPGLILGHTCA